VLLYTAGYLRESHLRYLEIMPIGFAGSEERRYFLIGGAGFIGSHFTDRLLRDAHASGVTIFDNFSSGRPWHYESHTQDARLQVLHGDVNDLQLLTASMHGHNVVIHLASNPDIARAVHEPEVDFYQGTLLTNNVVEAMRRAQVPHLLYASGSGVYGELGEMRVAEDYGPLVPISTYGASKLAGEALIASYCAMFGLTACAFRFANVVGARQTHGVGFDFVRRLRTEPTRLQILGDGRQSKSYIHVSVQARAGFTVWNVATEDAITVTEIAQIAVACLGLKHAPQFEYTGGDRGWKGDVPVMRLDASRIRSLGWTPKFNSHAAIQKSIEELIADERILQN
jgi:UDP-glucose 4-epimerase